MFVELHMLQNFAPANLNRDDTNSPKDCEFGGFRRARISSQCLKRAKRTEFRRGKLIDRKHLSERTKLLCNELARRLAAGNRSEETARRVAEFAINATGLAVKDGKTEYLLFLGAAELDKFAKLIADSWPKLVSALEAATEQGEKKTGRQAKKQAKAQAPEEISKAAIKTLLDGGKAADLALFGRMLADLPDQNVNAACQVAHAISTNKVDMEFDFYTAVDDLQLEAETGAGMMGTIEFNSSCFYRYSNIDVEQLTKNLQGDTELSFKTVEAFIRASITAIPTGKQNSMAAQNLPSFVLAVVREGGLWSLANAFVKPVWARRDSDLISDSIARLDDYWDRLATTYGEANIRKKAVLSLNDHESLNALKSSLVKANAKPAVDVFVETVLNSLGGQQEEARA